jgi:hypothetical protein
VQKFPGSIIYPSRQHVVATPVERSLLVGHFLLSFGQPGLNRAVTYTLPTNIPPSLIFLFDFSPAQVSSGFIFLD